MSFFLKKSLDIIIIVPQVGWLRAEDQTILSMGDRKVIQSTRFFVTLENAKTKNQTQSREDEEATWQLHIRGLKEADRGCYMCQLNTKPMLSQLGCVDVLGMPNCTRYVAFRPTGQVCGCWQRRHIRTHARIAFRLGQVGFRAGKYACLAAGAARLNRPSHTRTIHMDVAQYGEIPRYALRVHAR